MDTVEITLPVSGKKVVIRNYTTRKDDERAETVLYAGVSAEQDGTSGQTIKFPIANVMASQKSYIPRLVQSIDGNDVGVEGQLGDLRSEDYAAIEKAVTEIVEAHSPKAQEAANASKSITSGK